MTPNARYKRPPITLAQSHEAVLRDRIMLKLARVAIALMLPMIAFLMHGYLDSIRKTMDSMAASIERISDAQERLSIVLARVDEAVHHIERRLDKNEDRTDFLQPNKP